MPSPSASKQGVQHLVVLGGQKKLPNGRNAVARKEVTFPRLSRSSAIDTPFSVVTQLTLVASGLNSKIPAGGPRSLQAVWSKIPDLLPSF
jgi:hypothetical protein